MQCWKGNDNDNVNTDTQNLHRTCSTKEGDACKYLIVVNFSRRQKHMLLCAEAKGPFGYSCEYSKRSLIFRTVEYIVAAIVPAFRAFIFFGGASFQVVAPPPPPPLVNKTGLFARSTHENDRTQEVSSVYILSFAPYNSNSKSISKLKLKTNISNSESIPVTQTQNHNKNKNCNCRRCRNRTETEPKTKPKCSNLTVL